MSEEPTGNLVIYQTEDGRAQVECRLVDETIWLSQALMGELFDRSKKTISEHLLNLVEEGELDPDSVVRNFRTTAEFSRNPSKAPTGRHHASPGQRPGSNVSIESGALKGRNMGGGA